MAHTRSPSLSQEGQRQSEWLLDHHNSAQRASPEFILSLHGWDQNSPPAPGIHATKFGPRPSGSLSSDQVGAGLERIPKEDAGKVPNLSTVCFGFFFPLTNWEMITPWLLAINWVGGAWRETWLNVSLEPTLQPRLSGLLVAGGRGPGPSFWWISCWAGK